MADLPQQGESVPDLELTTESGEHIGTGELRGQMIVLYRGSGSADEQGPSRRSSQGRVETSSPTPPRASTPTRRSSRTTDVGPRRSLRPAKDRSATTSWRCQPRSTYSGSRDCSRPGRSGCPSSGPTSSTKRPMRSRRSALNIPRASAPSG